MTEYKYEDPRNNGFKKVTITKEQHNELFQYQQITWKMRYEYYIKDTAIEIHRYSSIWLKMYNTMMFPVVLLFAGLSNFDSVIQEYKHHYCEQKYGAFTNDTVFKNTKRYDLFKECLQNE